MVLTRWRPVLAPDFRSGARAYAADLAMAFAVFIGAALAAGRVWRFPFDDEIYTLETIERLSARALLIDFPRHSDVHPPLSI